MPKFTPGTSGNPAGRPKGSGYADLRAQIAAAAPEIVSTLIAAAKAGDSRAARLLLERVIPSLRADSEPLTLETVPETLPARLEAVTAAMLTGKLTPTQAREILTTLCAAAGVAREASQGRSVIWMVPPELSMDDWAEAAQKHIQHSETLGYSKLD